MKFSLFCYVRVQSEPKISSLLYNAVLKFKILLLLISVKAKHGAIHCLAHKYFSASIDHPTSVFPMVHANNSGLANIL